MSKKNIRTIAIFVGLFIVSTIFFTIAYFEQLKIYFESSFLQGWDGAGHYAAGKYYVENIFPSTWGWLHAWNGGIPFPQFYSPGLNMILGVLYYITAFSFVDILHVLVIVLFFSLPGISYFITYKITKNIYASLAAFLISLLVYSMYALRGLPGATMTGVLNNSYASHTLGIFSVMVWVYYFLDAKVSRRSWYISIFALALVFISNVHVLVFTFVFFVLHFLYSCTAEKIKDKKLLLEHVREYLVLGGVPLLLVAFWFLPLMMHRMFTSSVALDTVYFSNEALLKAYSLVIGISIVAFLIAIKKNHIGMKALTTASICVFIFALLKVGVYFTDLPFHTERWLAFIPLFTGVVTGYCLSFVRTKLVAISVSVVSLLLVLPHWGVGFFYEAYHGFYLQYEEDRLEEIISFLQQDPQTSVLVEANFDKGQSRSHSITALIGAGGVETNFFVLRESSINAIFMTPIRNSFSWQKDHWESYRSFLAEDKEYLRQDIQKHIDNLRYSGITHLMISSRYSRDLLDSNPNFSLDMDFGNWAVYSLNDSRYGVEFAPYTPIVVYGEHGFKNKSYGAYTYTRLIEELMFAGRMDESVVLAREQYLDSSEDLFRTDTVFIFEYKYKDIEKAKDRLLEYSKENMLVLLEDRDPLFELLLKEKTDEMNIVILDDLRGAQEISTVRTQIQGVLKRNIIPAENVVTNSVLSVNKSPNHVSVDFSEPTNELKPVIVKTSYMTSWKRTDGEELFMVSPSYILTYANDDFELTFTTPPSVYIGWTTSILTALALILLYLQERNKKMQKLIVMIKEMIVRNKK